MPPLPHEGSSDANGQQQPHSDAERLWSGSKDLILRIAATESAQAHDPDVADAGPTRAGKRSVKIGEQRGVEIAADHAADLRGRVAHALPDADLEGVHFGSNGPLGRRQKTSVQVTGVQPGREFTELLAALICLGANEVDDVFGWSKTDVLRDLDAKRVEVVYARVVEIVDVKNAAGRSHAVIKLDVIADLDRRAGSGSTDHQHQRRGDCDKKSF